MTVDVAARARIGSVSVVTPVTGAADDLARRLRADPSSWLPPPAYPVGAAVWVVTLRGGPVPRRVRCRVGEPVVEVGGVSREVEWHPAPGGTTAALLLPILRGELGLLVGEVPTVFLTGTYRPPGGAVGAELDARGLRRVAESTARRFVDEVCRGLTAPPGTR